METKAVHRYLNSFSLWTASIAALAAIAGLALFVSPASAKRHTLVGRDGKIHACYRVKGKPKGMVRVVRGRSHHCRRGERRMAWSVVSAPAAGGAAGAQGGAGSQGTSASGASTPTGMAALETQVADLTLKLKALEGLLGGVDTGDLSGVLSRVNTLEGVLEGVDHSELTGALENLEDVCTQTTALTTATNLLGEEFGGLLTTLGGTLLGPIFNGFVVPDALSEALTCPTFTP